MINGERMKLDLQKIYDLMIDDYNESRDYAYMESLEQMIGSIIVPGPVNYNVLDEDDGAIDTPDFRMDDGLDLPIKKVDHGKPDLSRILDAPISMEGLAACLKMGESKDDRTRLSWKDYDDPEGLISALLRHLTAWQSGEVTDPESGLNHLQHVVTNAVMLCETNPSISDGELIKGN